MSSHPLRTRERIHNRVRNSARSLFRSSRSAIPSPAPPPSSAAAQSHSSVAPQPPPPALTPCPATPSQKILIEAQKLLSLEQRKIISAHVLSGSQDIQAAVEDAYKAAAEQKRKHDDRRWTWKFRGRQIILGDEAEKIALGLDKFKAIGDVVANVDPVHVGLPWAGIRLILAVVTSDQKQMAILLTGMELILSLANRLRVYLMSLERLPSTIAANNSGKTAVVQARNNFQDALIKMSSLILQFLANAISIYDKGRAAQIWQAFWKSEDLEKFEIESTQLARSVEDDASIFWRELQEQRWEGAKQWMDNFQVSLQKLDEIKYLQNSVDAHRVEAQIARVIVAKGAVYNSYEDEFFSYCLAGTRTGILQQVSDWANDPNGKAIFWLRGMAGTGKSTISRTVARAFDHDKQLGASFFFKRGERNRSNGLSFFPTIAVHLTRRIPGLRQKIAGAMEKDPSLCEKNLHEQFENFLKKPLADMVSNGVVLPSVVLVIDALDECSRPEEIKRILSLLSQLHRDSGLRLRVFATSRPENGVKLGFQDVDGKLHHDIELEEVQRTTIENDIRLYIQHRFEIIKKEDKLMPECDRLPIDWPGDSKIEMLINLAVPLFISAFTLCRYISESNPERRLKSILRADQKPSALTLENTYKPILEQLLLDQDEVDQDQILTEFREVVGSIIVLADPLSISALSSLLNLSTREIRETLRGLNSVLNIPTKNDVPVRPLHLSFHDFLLNNKAKERNKFWIDATEVHGRLAKQCLRLLRQSGSLKEDLLDLGKPGTRRAAVDHQQVHRHIPDDIAYACSYWAWHLVQSEENISDHDDVHQFLQDHFLHWLEAMSWLGRLSSAVIALSDLRGIVQVERGGQIFLFLDDAKQFLLQNRYIIEFAPLQLYSSALIFWPTESLIKRHFYNPDSHRIMLYKQTSFEKSSESVRFEGHKGCVRAIAFSPDGQVIASGAHDRTVRLWNPVTGEEVLKFEKNNKKISVIAFSRDGCIIASGTSSGEIWLWSRETGDEIFKLEGHTGEIGVIAFCPNDCTLISRSWDKTIRLWNVANGHEILILRSPDRTVDVAFSPDGRNVMSAVVLGAIGTAPGKIVEVRQWDVETAIETPKFRCDTKDRGGIAFAPDGKTIAVVNDDAIQLLDTTTGRTILSLKSKIDVGVITFSLDSSALATASRSGVLKLWDLTTGELMMKSEGLPYLMSVAITPEHQLVATGSADGVVRSWAIATPSNNLNQLRKVMSNSTTPSFAHGYNFTNIVFSPDSQMVASGDTEGAVWLWKATGEEILQLRRHDGDDVVAIAFSPNSRVVASVNTYGRLQLWNTTGEQIFDKGWDGLGLARRVTLSEDGQMVALYGDETLRVWNVTGEEMLMLRTQNDITVVAFSPDSQMLALGFENEAIELWDLAGKKTLRLKGYNGPVTAVVFSPENRIIASVSSDKTLRLWNATGMQESQLDIGHNRFARLSFSPTGQVVLSTSRRRWDRPVYMQTGQDHSSLDHQGEFVRGSQVGSVDRDANATISARTVPDIASIPTLAVWDHWIQYLDEDFLWLPVEYRDISAAQGNLLVVGGRTGILSWFKTK